MNRRPLNSLSLQKAITGFVNYKTAEGLSDRSVDSYRRILERWAEFAGNKNVAQFTDHDVNSYLVYMRTEYVPSRWSRDTRNLSPKTLHNIWITMCSFFRWANSEFHIESPMKNVPAPRFQKVEIEAFTRDEVSRMLKACTYSKEAGTTYRRQFVMRRPTANRDQAVILTLLDSCVRASEFCAFRVGDFDPKRGKLEIRHGTDGGAKGGKGRAVYLGKTARNALWRYLAQREDGEDPNAPLFVVREGRPFNPSSLRHIIKSIAARAEVKDAHPHRFRHIGAITYLRSGRPKTAVGCYPVAVSQPCCCPYAPFGPIVVLVNNAGYSMLGALEQVSEEQTQRVFDVNVFGALRMIRAVVPHMRKQRSGRIINISSISGKLSTPANGVHTQRPSLPWKLLVMRFSWN